LRYSEQSEPQNYNLKTVQWSVAERGCNDLLRDFVFAKNFSGRKKANHNNKTLAFRSKPTKPQFKALNTIKPEATKHKCNNF